MATDIGKAYVQIVPSAKGISGSISKVLNGESISAGKNAGNNVAGQLVSTIKKVIGAAALGSFIKESLNFGAELEQNLGGTEAVFNDFAVSIQNKAKDAYKNMGLSASEYMATANKMGSLFQGSGLKQAKAVQLTEEAMQRAADVASVMGIDTTAAMESIAGAAKGNFTMMDNLGVAMNATTLSAYALEKKMYSFDWNKATNAQKAELAMQMFMERTEQYAGNFARESEETFSGSLGAMKSAAENFMANLSLGQNVGPALKSLIDTTRTFLIKNLIPAVANIAKEFPSAIFQGLEDTFPELKGYALEFLDSITSFINDGLPSLITEGEQILITLSQGIIDNLPEFITKGVEILQGLSRTIIENLPSIISTGIEIMVNLAVGIIDYLPTFFGKLAEGFLSLDWMEIGKNIILGIVDGVVGAVGRLVEACVNAAKKAFNAVKEFLGIASPSKKFRFLGQMTGEGLAEGLYDSSGIVQNAVNNLMNPFANPMINGGTLALASGPAVGGLSVYFNIDNSGKDITDQDIERWTRKIFPIIDEAFGRSV